jgi:polyhydroxybutyrate depolymerase
MSRLKITTCIAFLMLILSNLLAQKTLDKTISHGGLTRQYRLYIPANYDGSKSVPLLFNFHGFTSNNQQQEFYGDFRPISNKEGFIICLPQGTVGGPTNQTFFNVGFFPSPVDDLGFTNMLIDSISTTYKIDAKRIYSCGMSNGGFMSYHLACNSSRFAAVASVTGSFTESMAKTCKPLRPTPIIEIHGTADATVPYTGMTGALVFLSIDSVLSYWVKFNKCNPTATVTDVPNINTTDNATAKRFVWTGGKDGVTVEHFKVQGGAHTWPGAAIPIGVTCQDFKASDEIWRFFKQYTLTVSANDILSENSFKIYPNPTSNQVTIETDEQAEYQVQIIDLQGKMMLKSNIIGSQKTLDVADLPNGIYVIRVSSEKGQINQKFVKN